MEFLLIADLISSLPLFHHRATMCESAIAGVYLGEGGMRYHTSESLSGLRKSTGINQITDRLFESSSDESYQGESLLSLPDNELSYYRFRCDASSEWK
ncbi:Hypothetical protein CINCED_3A011832 [Cinara cedri]|uniref:Uncharacterized protein n=1 Tax=Cinara cedri TaxID=506608 RepID=A0A5E4MGY3_9HEMI|nr:Hypothetical protein CINCED_3A011832 [Cinara cedri]